MPELPDITVYVEALRERAVGQRVARIRIHSPSLLRTAQPPISSLEGARIEACASLGKRITFGFDNDHWLILHLMIAGRLEWHEEQAGRPTRITAAVIELESGAISVTEAGTKKRASLHVVPSEQEMLRHDRRGLDSLTANFAAFRVALTRENHTLKRALTDPRILSGIGNAYSDEILFRARLSPLRLTSKLSDDELRRLHEAVRGTLTDWTERLRKHYAGRFPTKVTAFRPDMDVHGRYGESCRVCGTTIQRIRYASNETNYCPRCQTGGRLLADRSLSRLLKDDWPRSIDELEQRET